MTNPFVNPMDPEMLEEIKELDTVMNELIEKALFGRDTPADKAEGALKVIAIVLKLSGMQVQYSERISKLTMDYLNEANLRLSNLARENVQVKRDAKVLWDQKNRAIDDLIRTHQRGHTLCEVCSKYQGQPCKKCSFFEWHDTRATGRYPIKCRPDPGISVQGPEGEELNLCKFKLATTMSGMTIEKLVCDDCGSVRLRFIDQDAQLRFDMEFASADIEAISNLLDESD